MAITLLYLIVGFMLFEFILTKTLGVLNHLSWNKPIPPDAEGLYDAAKYEEAKKYASLNFKFGLVSSTLSLLISLSFLLLGGFAYVDGIATGYSEHVVLQALVFFGLLALGSFLINLPMDLYHTFVVEERFGFNKTSLSTFIGDKIKTVLLTVILGGGILALLTWLYQVLGPYFWIAGWLVVGSISIFMAMFYTNLLLPVFNKLTPLEPGALRQSIENYASTVQFPLTNIMVMDGSKRSSKANAFFSGIGSRKNIVLFDNLIKDLSTEEITAVLAHEVGHYKKKHVLQGMAIGILQMGVMFFLFGWLASNPVMAEVLGAEKNSFHLSLIVFSMLYSPINLITSLLSHLLSRKNEYEADNYAKATYGAEPLIRSLKKLTVNHLSNVQPHPAYVFFNYSHPTLLQRMRNLRS
ncbi:MAG: M48 family metallopeptidase [Bacteroidetes bacterium]|nr:M48 family metallopeptidase [Bacteroidota bacterium]